MIAFPLFFLYLCESLLFPLDDSLEEGETELIGCLSCGKRATGKRTNGRLFRHL